MYERVSPRRLLLKESGNKVLIFSQFTTALDLLEDCLKTHEWQCYRICGVTSLEDRQSQIDRFNRGGDAHWIFLISTRAGGVGINLQGADTVVFLDSDYNPQQDNQAVARARDC